VLELNNLLPISAIHNQAAGGGRKMKEWELVADVFKAGE